MSKVQSLETCHEEVLSYKNMKRITESQKRKLAKLKFRDPVQYQQQLDSLGIREKTIQEYIDNEETRIRSISRIGYAVFDIPKKVLSADHSRKTQSLYSSNYRNPVKRKTYIMIDGDNTPIKNMEGYPKAKSMPGITIEVFVANPSLAERYRKEYDIIITEVTPGNQAVDNRIKAIAGNMAKNHEYDRLVIISHDQGYRQKIQEWKRKYHWNDKQIRLCKNIKSAIS